MSLAPPCRVLIAGVGNIFAGDDAFGVEVARRLALRKLPEGVRVVDFGTRSIDLAYALADGCEAAVLIDTAARGGAPGTLYVIEAEAEEDAGELALSHDLDATAVIGAARGTRCRRVLVVGCEPQTLEAEDFGLSAPVARAVDEAAGVVESLALELLGDGDEQG